jgi:uncharacterized protein (DUF1330 family)
VSAPRSDQHAVERWQPLPLPVQGRVWVLGAAAAASLADASAGTDGVDDDGVVGDGGVVAGQGRLGGRFDHGVLQVRSGEPSDRCQRVLQGEYLQLDVVVVVAPQQVGALVAVDALEVGQDRAGEVLVVGAGGGGGGVEGSDDRPCPPAGRLLLPACQASGPRHAVAACLRVLDRSAKAGRVVWQGRLLVGRVMVGRRPGRAPCRRRRFPAMAAYVIVETDITDPARYEQYKAASPGAIAAGGGRFVVRGGELAVLEGDWQPSRLVVLEFEDLAAAKRWYQSETYQQAKKLREGAAHLRMVAVQGVD